LRYALQGVPALLALVGVGILAYYVKAEENLNLATKYRFSAYTAARQEKYDVARSLLEKAIKLDSGKDEFRFALASVFEQESQRKELKESERIEKMQHCVAIMKKLAPDNANGYPTAHMWIGEYYWRNYAWTNEIVDAIENHFRKAWIGASSANPDSPESKYAALRLGGLLFARQRYEESVMFMELATERFPYVRLPLAAAYLRLNRQGDMDRTLEALANKCKQKIDENVNDKEARVNWASALAGLKKYAEAIEVLKAGTMHDRNEAQFAQMIANVYANWDASLAQNKNAKLIERFALVQQGLMHHPTNIYLLSQLLTFAELKGEDGDKAKEIMQKLLVEGNSAPIIHFLLGQKAYKDGRETEAQYHWEKAFKLDPNFAVVANNLAWILSHQKEPDYERALKIINDTIQKVPGVDNFYGTRGEILNRMGKHKEALPDLERGIRVSPNDSGLQEGLAICHRSLGNIQMAEIHQKKADELRASAKRQLPTTLEQPAANSPANTPASPLEPKEKKPTDPNAKSG